VNSQKNGRRGIETVAEVEKRPASKYAAREIREGREEEKKNEDWRRGEGFVLAGKQ